VSKVTTHSLEEKNKKGYSPTGGIMDSEERSIKVSIVGGKGNLSTKIHSEGINQIEALGLLQSALAQVISSTEAPKHYQGCSCGEEAG